MQIQSKTHTLIFFQCFLLFHSRVQNEDLCDQYSGMWCFFAGRRGRIHVTPQNKKIGHNYSSYDGTGNAKGMPKCQLLCKVVKNIV